MSTPEKNNSDQKPTPQTETPDTVKDSKPQGDNDNKKSAGGRIPG